MSDKRSVATDALETLGTIIDDKAKRARSTWPSCPRWPGRT